VPTPGTFAVSRPTDDGLPDSDPEGVAPALLDTVASDGAVSRLLEVSAAGGVPDSPEQAASTQSATATMTIRT